jgi:hypothetical protein
VSSIISRSGRVRLNGCPAPMLFCGLVFVVLFVGILGIFRLLFVLWCRILVVLVL